MKTIFCLLIAVTIFNYECKTKKSSSLQQGEQIVTISDSVKLAVEIAGSGPVCIYVHGGPGQDYLSFEKMGGENLENCLTMVYLDQRGSGHSSNAKNYSLQRVIDDIEAVRKSIGVDKVYLLSHSFGGVLATNYAKKYPEHVQGLILANATLHFFDTTTLRQQIQYGYKQLGIDTTISSGSQPTMLKRMMQMRQALSKDTLGYKLIADSVKTIILMDSIENSYKRTQDLAANVVLPLLDSTKKLTYPDYFNDYTSITKDIKCPVLIITGTHDYAVSPDHYKLFHFPNETVKQIDGSHMLYYEHNKEFVDAVCDFVK